MKFRVYRTRSNQYELGKSPCDGARAETVMRRIAISALGQYGTTPKECGYKVPDSFLSFSGTNHRIEGDWFIRDKGPQDVWVMDFNTMEELILFSEEYGDIVFCAIPDKEIALPTIEIYDDRRE